MRSIILGFLLLSAVSYGQSTLAKIKFEQAETAYKAQNYLEALAYLSETEKLLKGSNSTITYLQILVQHKLLESDSAHFNDLVGIRRNCEYFLKSTDGIVELEAKFKEVYFISEELGKLPSNETDFQNYKLARLEQRKQDELMESRSVMAGIALGMKIDQIPQATWNTMERQGYDFEAGSRLYSNHPRKVELAGLFATASTINAVGLTSITVIRPAQTVFSVSQLLATGGKSDKETLLQNYYNRIQELNKEYGETNVVKTDNEQKTGRVKSLTKIAVITINKKMTYSLSYIVTTTGTTVNVYLMETISEL